MDEQAGIREAAGPVMTCQAGIHHDAAGIPGAAGADPVLAFLAEAQVLSVLAGAGPLPQDVIARKVDPGYQALVPDALARLAGQDLARCAVPGSGLWIAAA